MKVLRGVSEYLEDVNYRIYIPRGLFITDPMERGMRVVRKLSKDANVIVVYCSLRSHFYASWRRLRNSRRCPTPHHDQLICSATDNVYAKAFLCTNGCVFKNRSVSHFIRFHMEPSSEQIQSVFSTHYSKRSTVAFIYSHDHNHKPLQKKSILISAHTSYRI